MGAARWWNAAGAALCFAAIGYAIGWLQLGLGLEPCPLCILDRVAFALAGLVFLLAALHGPRPGGRRVYAVVALVPVAFGLAVAGRHLWLQSLPAEQVPACGPSLDYMLDHFPLQRVIDLVLRGSGACAEIQWQFLGGSIAAWTFALFVVLALVAFGLLLAPGGGQD